MKTKTKDRAPKTANLADLKEVLLKRALSLKVQAKAIAEELESINNTLGEYLNVGDTLACSAGTVLKREGRISFSIVGTKETIQATRAELIERELAEYKTGDNFLEYRASKLS